MHRSLAVFALALALTVPASASAAPRQVAMFVPSFAEPFAALEFNSWATPVLAGEDAVWARSRPSGGWVVERAAPGERRSRVAFSARPTRGYRVLQRITMAGGSPTHVAWSDSAVEVFSASHMSYSPVRSRVLATTPGAAPVPIVGCEGAEDCRADQLYGDHSYASSLDGQVVAYIEGRYPDYTIVVDDLASAADPVRISTGPVYLHVRVAGDYVAYVDASANEPQAVVYDWRARREVYRVPGSGGELQSDGKLATAGEDGIRWYSPAEPRAHTIDPPPRGSFGAVRIAGDRLLAVERGSVSGPQLTLMDLDGGRRRMLGSVLQYPAGYGFDGKRATWATADCGFVSIWLDPDVDVDEPRPSEPAPPPCTPPSFRGITAGQDGRVLVKLVCEDSCRGRLSVYVDPVLGSAHPLAHRRIGLGASARERRVYLTPSKADRARLRKRPSPLHIQAIFEGRDRDRAVAATKSGSLKRR